MANGIVFADIRFPEVLDLPPDPRWKTGITAQHIVLTHFSGVLSWRQGVLENADSTAVHQIRVSTRRTRTALQTFSHIWDPETIRTFIRRLGKFADRFGNARDLDVMLEHLEDKTGASDTSIRPAYQSLIRRMRRLRKAQQPKLLRALDRFEASGLAGELVEYISNQPADMWSLGGRS